MNIRGSKRKGYSDHNTRLTDRIKSPAPRGILACSLRGLIASVFCLAILLFPISAIVYASADPNHYVIPASLLILYVSSLVGGFSAAKLNRGSALLCGILTGLLYLAILIPCSLLIDPTLSSDPGVALSLGLKGILLVVSVLGALIGVTNKKKRKRK